MLGVGIESPGNGLVQATIYTGFQPAFLAATNVIFAYSDYDAFNLRFFKLEALLTRVLGHFTFFGFMSEFESPVQCPKSTLPPSRSTRACTLLSPTSPTVTLVNQSLPPPLFHKSSPPEDCLRDRYQYSYHRRSNQRICCHNVHLCPAVRDTDRMSKRTC